VVSPQRYTTNAWLLFTPGQSTFSHTKLVTCWDPQRSSENVGSVRCSTDTTRP